MVEPFEIHVYSIDQFKEILATNSQASLPLVTQKSHITYFEQYFKHLHAKTLLVEHNYVDRDFLEDFAGYYARCFPNYTRQCVRIHVFSCAFTTEEFRLLLAKPSDSTLAKTLLQEHYLGFIVVKPLPRTIIGRTCLATYPDDHERRHFPIVRRYKVNLFGLPLSVKTLAFQEQDQVAAACATSALWTVFQGTGMRFQHAIPSPVEITKRAFNSFPLATRALPNEVGLSPEMMAQAIRDIGLEPFLISLGQEPKDIHLFKSQVYAYLRCGIPLVLGFTPVSVLLDQNNLPYVAHIYGKHAVAITGYSLGHANPQPNTSVDFLLRASRMDKIYAHDDQVGPFARMEFDRVQVRYESKLFNSMSTSWGGENKGIPDMLLVPLYHKIRIPFELVHNTVLHFDHSVIEQLRDEGKLPSISTRLEWDIYLTTINDLKSDVFADTNLNEDLRQEILLRSLPRFLWRATAYLRGEKALDLLFDATDIAQNQFLVSAIEYNKELSDVLRDITKEPSIAKTFQTTAEGKILEWFRTQPLS